MQRYFQHRWPWLLVLASMMSADRGALAQEADATALPAAAAPAADAEQITAWIAELDDNRYQVREEATQKLLQSVTEGDTAALDPLLAAANGDRPEQEDRAIWILRKLIGVEDLELRQQVLQRLVQVKDRPQVLAEAAAALANIRHEFAVRAIERLGGHFFETGQDTHWQQIMPRRIVLADEWRGGDDGLKYCADLRDVPLVMVFGTDVTADGLAQLSAATSLRQLKLYGTQLKESEVDQLRGRLPGLEIDYRLGGFLGVIGATGPNAAVVQTVQPNTAAAEAGLRPLDQIRKFNGIEVNNFETLTKEIAKHGPGTEVTLEITREGTPQEVKLKLGKWQPR